MFTGIVQHVGRVATVQSTASGARLWLDIGPLVDGLKNGDSVAVNGACLTACEIRRDRVGFDAVAETLKRTGLGSLRSGDRVNLERALRAGDGLDGHIVQGHVDGVARVTKIDRAAGQWNIHFGCESSLSDEMVTKGSVAIDGVSLTLTGVADGAFSVTIIPTTLGGTTLAALSVGESVNIETDILGKYVRRMLASTTDRRAGQAAGSSLTLEKLNSAGFMD